MNHTYHYKAFYEGITHEFYCRYSLSEVKTRMAVYGFSVLLITDILYR